MTTDQQRGKWTSSSNAQADTLCPGRHLAQRDIPEAEPGADADFGSKVHEALSGRIDPEVLDVEQRSVYDSCCDIELKLVRQVFPTVNATRDAAIREKRLWVKLTTTDNRLNAWIEHSGMPDCVYISKGIALVIEYKTLAGDVATSPKNYQLRDQAVLVDRNSRGLQQIFTAVVQPLVTHTPIVCVFERSDLDKAFLEATARIFASNDPASPRHAGPAQCKFCRATKSCPEYQTWVSGMMPATTRVSDVPMESWTPEQRAIVAANLPIIAKWAEDAKEFLKDCLHKDPQAVPGFGLKDCSERKKVKDPQAVLDRFIAAGGTLPQFIACISVSNTALKERLSEATKLRGRKLDAAMKELLDGLVEITRTAPSIERVKE